MSLYYVSIGQKEYKVEISENVSRINGEEVKAVLTKLGERGLYLLKLGSQKRELHVHSQGKNQYVVNNNGRFAVARVEKSTGLKASRIPGKRVGDISAPISGLVISVNIKVGDLVSEGDVLVVMESMKMQMMIKSPVSGKVSHLNVIPGSQPAKGELLVRFE